MKKKTRGYLLQIVVLLALIAIGLWRHQHRTYHNVQQAFVMDTLFEIELESEIRDMSSIIDSCFSLARKYEGMFSAYAENGDLQKVNDNAGKGLMTINEELVFLLKKSGIFYRDTDGRYDITIGKLIDLWDINNNRIPTQEEISEALKTTGYEKLILNGNVISVPEGMKLNLGSIAKGYVVDKIVKYIESEGIDKYIVNAGGDLYIKSDKAEIIGIQHPRKNRGEVIDRLKISEAAIVSSGDYERYFELDGKRYHHIIDAKTGYPSDNCIAVTAICDDAGTADALATAAFLLKPKEGVKLADKFTNAAVIIYYQNENGEIKKVMNNNAEKYMESNNG